MLEKKLFTVCLVTGLLLWWLLWEYVLEHSIQGGVPLSSAASITGVMCGGEDM